MRHMTKAAILVAVDPAGLMLLFGFFAILFDFLLWGTTGYMVLCSLGCTDRDWFLGGMVISATYLVFGQLLATPAALAPLDGDEMKELMALDVGDIVLSAAIEYVGFGVGKWLLHALARQSEHSCSCSNV